MGRLLLWWLAPGAVLVVTLLAQVVLRRRARDRRARKEQADLLWLLGDLGEAHPLWTAPRLCPDDERPERFRGGAPAWWPGLNFCPPVRLGYLRHKLIASGQPMEYDGTSRKLNDSMIDSGLVLADYWMLGAHSILSLMRAQVSLSMWLVNIGAAPTSIGLDGFWRTVPGDDLTSLWYMGYRGVNFEMEAKREITERHYGPWPKAILEFDATTPEELVRRLRLHSVPEDLDIVKIDIDATECEYLEALMDAGFRPKVVTMELAAAWPPPLRFKMKSEDFPTAATRYTTLQGCSLQYAVDVLRPLGYTLIQYVVEDGWFVQNEYAGLFGPLERSTEDLYEKGNPGMFGKWPYPELQWRLHALRDRPREMLAEAERSAEAMRQLRPGLRDAKYVLEV